MKSRRRIQVSRGLVALAIATVIAGSGLGASASVAVARNASTGNAIGWIDAAAGASALVPPGLWDALGQSQTINPGADGVLNILLLGSDTRNGTAMGRTDTIMVFSLKGNSLRAASIPRDTAKIPNPAGGTFKGRVNAILKKLKTQYGSNEVALQKFEEVIEHLLQIPIDYHALTTFVGFHGMVDAVDPIPVTYSKEIKDSTYWDDPNRPKGVYFPPNQNDYQLYAYQPNEPSRLCNGLWRTQGTNKSELWCHRAMPYVRSRKGPGNSDWKRAGRQQDFVYATVTRVVNDPNGANIRTLLFNAATDQKNAFQLRTNIPISAADISDLYNRVKNSTRGNSAVFGPSTYATHISGTTAYQLKLSVVRAWADTNLQ